MINVIVELSKYVILTLMVIYTFHCFYMVKQQSEEERNESLRQQLMLIFFMDFTAFLVIYLKTDKFQVVIFYIEMMAFFAVLQIVYRLMYKKASILLLNNMCMLLSVGFIMLCRLDPATATRQLVIVAGVNAVALIVPVLIRKMKFLKDLTWIYAGIGIVQYLYWPEQVTVRSFPLWEFSRLKRLRSRSYSLWRRCFGRELISERWYRPPL